MNKWSEYGQSYNVRQVSHYAFFHHAYGISNAMTATLIRPSTILPEGICIQQVNNLMLFKFTDQLGQRMQELLDKKKANALSSDEVIELETIGELDNIFSYINAVIATQVNATA